MAAGQLARTRAAVRSACRSLLRRSPTLSLALVAAGRRAPRTSDHLSVAYGEQWGRFEAYLDRAGTLDAWLHLAGVDDVPDSVQVDGQLRFASFDHVGFLAGVIAETLRLELPGVRSLTEYGCGVGRNVLALRRLMPELSVAGYDLTEDGVRVACRAAQKFGVPARFARLDYVEDPESAYVLGRSDVALTVYSLVDVPSGADVALRHMLERVDRALVLVEPVAERYPLGYRGLLGRAYVRARGYLEGLDAMVRSLPASRVRARLLATSNNPLMYPTVYVIEK